MIDVQYGGTKLDLQQYLKDEFVGVSLFDDSFVGKEFAVRIKLEKKLYQLKDDSDEINPQYFRNVYEKATQIFNEVFKDNDELYLVAHIRSELNSKKRKSNIFNRYLKNTNDKYKLKYKQVLLDDDEKIEQFSVFLSSKNKINYSMLIKAICNQDFRSLQPRFNSKYTYYPEIFFINKNKNVILNIFDDRGCFVLFNNPNDFYSFSEKYNEFLFEEIY